MISDITIGQYYSGTSVIHRMDARMKFVLTMALIVILFVCRNFYSLALGFVFVVAALLLSRVPMKMMWRSIKPLVILMLFTAAINVFYNRGGETLVSFWIFRITREGIRSAIFMVLRISMLVAGTFMLTYTTSPIALTDALESLFGPLKKLHVPVHELAMMMCIALRFIPTLIEETDKIIAAQKARGADFESGNLIARAKALVPILVPLFISAFRRADELATAMECRCYHGGEGRTRLHQLKYEKRDYIAFGVGAAFLAAMIVLRQFGL